MGIKMLYCRGKNKTFKSVRNRKMGLIVRWIPRIQAKIIDRRKDYISKNKD